MAEINRYLNWKMLIYLLFLLIFLAGVTYLIPFRDNTSERKLRTETLDNEESQMISELLLNPTDYLNGVVEVTGKVEQAIEVSGTAYVQLSDDTGKIIVIFPADRDYMVSKGFLFLADPNVIGKTVTVKGTLRLNPEIEEGNFEPLSYLIEAEIIRLKKTPLNGADTEG